MKLPEAFAICKNIKICQRSDAEKGEAIYRMLNAETINSISKRDLLDIIEYLHGMCFEVINGNSRTDKTDRSDAK